MIYNNDLTLIDYHLCNRALFAYLNQNVHDHQNLLEVDVKKLTICIIPTNTINMTHPQIGHMYKL